MLKDDAGGGGLSGGAITGGPSPGPVVAERGRRGVRGSVRCDVPGVFPYRGVGRAGTLGGGAFQGSW